MLNTPVTGGRRLKLCIILTLTLMAHFLPFGRLSAQEVVVTIRPIHSLVASLTQGVTYPTLLVDQTISPHTATLKPSQVRAMLDARIVLWIGPGLESFLVKSIENLPSKVDIYTIAEKMKPHLLPLRSAHQNDHEHEHSEEGEEHQVSPADDGEITYDYHFWLDPDRVKIMLPVMLERLELLYPEHKERLRKNAEKLSYDLSSLSSELEQIMAPVQGKAYISFHDAFQYFDRRFSLRHGGVVLFNPEVGTSAAHIIELREEIAKQDITCIASEPQFNAGMVETISSDEGINMTIIDPLGSDIEESTTQYFSMMRHISINLAKCLTTK